jgi:hypothetical protein
MAFVWGPFPRYGLREVEVLTAPGWAAAPEPLLMDITPAAGVQFDDYDHGPIAVRERAFSHWGFTDDLGSITTESKFRLRDAGGATFRIVRIRDWHGFFQLDLDEVRGG